MAVILQAFVQGQQVPEASKYLFFIHDRTTNGVTVYFLVPEPHEEKKGTDASRS